MSDANSAPGREVADFIEHVRRQQAELTRVFQPLMRVQTEAVDRWAKAMAPNTC